MIVFFEIFSCKITKKSSNEGLPLDRKMHGYQFCGQRVWKEPAQRVLEGCFFGFRIHLVCKEQNKLINFIMTPRDADDRKPLEFEALTNFI